MIYDIKSFLLEEGILDHVKNNIGKYAAAGIGLAAAGSGEFGDDASHFANSVFDGASHGADKIMSHGSHLVNHYSGESDSPDHTQSNSNTDSHVQTADEYKKHLAEKAQHDALLTKANGPHSGIEHGTFYNNKVTVGNDGSVNKEFDTLTDTGVNTLAGAGIGLSGLGIMGAHKRDKRRIADAYRRGQASR